jgi:hypothetical protein
MRRPIPSAVLLALVLSGSAAAEETVHYRLAVRLDPDARRLAVEATIVLPRSTPVPIEFLLNDSLAVTSADPGVEVVPPGDPRPAAGKVAPAPGLPPGARRYRVPGGTAGGRLRLTYEGRFDLDPDTQPDERARGVPGPAGALSSRGVHLDGDSLWYPRVGPALVTFELEADVPPGWHLVSEGDGVSRDPGGRARWATTRPLESIHLVGGPLHVWGDRAGDVETLVYLREDDPRLAARYLAATARYLALYGALIGPYPYSKFALVEHFRETGYGMPSFTLLGPTVVRLPFIVESSYPHEILHNWWGNGVFVDEAAGNWSEGLTTYLADHLMEEQRGRGADYRRGVLQRYASYVRADRDFPLVSFRARDSAAAEAVGYGKTMMVVHMLRLRLGDERFRALLARFYRDFAGRRASFRDLQAAAEAVAGVSLAPFFDAWITRPGAPALAVASARADQHGGRWTVSASIRQVHDGAPYELALPVVVQTDTGPVRTTVALAGREASLRIDTHARPLALHVDPDHDVFRALDPRELPPSLGQIFGDARVLAVLPSAAPAAEREAWRALVEAWRNPAHAIEIVADADVAAPPPDRSTWLLGRDNRLAGWFVGRERRLRLEEAALVLGSERVPIEGHAAAVVTRHPAAPERAVGWIVNAVPPAFAGLARKLPHYGRYSYVAFAGDEPVNTLSGQWPADDSPLTIDLRPEALRSVPLAPLGRDPRPALVEPPPVFSVQALREHVERLADPAMEGRGIGTAGLQRAAEYLAARFEAIGLEPAGDAGGYFQHVPLHAGPGGRPAAGANVVGVLRGTNPAWRDEAVLVTAHYDHLGRGWPTAHAGDEGRVHPGANDNASGVAVLLELARVFAAGPRPARSIAFVAFTAEEAGRVGSTHFVERGHPFPVDRMVGVVNLDTVGGLRQGKVTVLGADTAAEWSAIFRGASLLTGVESVTVAGNDEASDQWTFRMRGVPAVQIFTGPDPDHHRPGDTADKVDVAGLVKVATLVREAVAYLAGRPAPLTPATPSRHPARTGPGEAAAAQATAEMPAPERRVSFGAVPDFAYAGPGVRLQGVTPGSPAAGAGLEAGDVIVQLDAVVVASLKDFSNALRALAPGQTVEVRFVRGGRERTVTVTVVER